MDRNGENYKTDKKIEKNSFVYFIYPKERWFASAHFGRPVVMRLMKRDNNYGKDSRYKGRTLNKVETTYFTNDLRNLPKIREFDTKQSLFHSKLENAQELHDLKSIW